MTNPLRLLAALCMAFLMRPTAGFAGDANEWFVRVGVLEAIYNPKFGGFPFLGLRRIAHYYGHDARFRR